MTSREEESRVKNQKKIEFDLCLFTDLFYS